MSSLRPIFTKFRLSPVGGGGSSAIGSAISGGTAGSVLFVDSTGALGQDNSNLFWDDANNRLGIGTSSPSATLHVVGNQFVKPVGATPIYEVLAGSDPTSTIALVTDNAAYGWQISPSTGSTETLLQIIGQSFVTVASRGEFGIYLGGNSNSALKIIQRGGSELFRITRTGLFGIGNVSSPVANFDYNPTNISGASGVTTGFWQFRSGGTYTDNATAGSGTAASFAFFGIHQQTLAATNGSVTTTAAATFYVANSPAAGTNMTITNAYAIWADAGLTRLDGGVTFAGSGQSTLSNYTEGTFTPTVTLVGGAGNTVPVYSTNTGRYTRVGNRVFVDVYLTGDGGAEGAGSGTFNVDLPITANASHPTSFFPAGYALNNVTEYVIYGQIAGSATTIALEYFNLISTTAAFTGADQNNATRTVRLKFAYEV